MKIIIEEILNIKETQIVIRCRERTGEIESIAGTLKLFDKLVYGVKEGETYILKPSEIYYFDSANDKVFCYTQKEVYQTSYRLYEIEQIFSGYFLRVNKNIILNTDKIKCFKSSLNGKIEATLDNGEKVEISRNYVPALKLKLGGNV